MMVGLNVDAAMMPQPSPLVVVVPPDIAAPLECKSSFHFHRRSLPRWNNKENLSKRKFSHIFPSLLGILSGQQWLSSILEPLWIECPKIALEFVLPVVSIWKTHPPFPVSTYLTHFLFLNASIRLPGRLEALVAPRVSSLKTAWLVQAVEHGHYKQCLLMVQTSGKLTSWYGKYQISHHLQFFLFAIPGGCFFGCLPSTLLCRIGGNHLQQKRQVAACLWTLE